MLTELAKLGVAEWVSIIGAIACLAVALIAVLESAYGDGYKRGKEEAFDVSHAVIKDLLSRGLLRWSSEDDSEDEEEHF